MMNLRPFQSYCDGRKRAHQFRTLHDSEPRPETRIRRDGRDYLNFASNDYLGLSHHPLLIERVQQAAADFGTGSTASRLVTGNHPLYARIEEKLAAGKGSETALVMTSGYATNLTVLAALADSSVIGNPVSILADKLIHNSLLMGGMLASGEGQTRLTRYRHNDYDHLRSLLQQGAEKDTQAVIVTESVFGMDGDIADLDILAALAREFDALLYVDEAHATGLYGANGFGFCAGRRDIDIAMGTFGKALGGFGSYVACSRALRDYLVQRCGGFIYSTALPPTVLAAIDAALDLIPGLQAERDHLAAQSARARDALKLQGWTLGTSTTHIIPVILGREEDATALADQLMQQGLLAAAIRPPTVPRGRSRLRLSLSAAHSAADIDTMLAAMESHAPRYAQAA